MMLFFVFARRRPHDGLAGSSSHLHGQSFYEAVRQRGQDSGPPRASSSSARKLFKGKGKGADGLLVSTCVAASRI